MNIKRSLAINALIVTALVAASVPAGAEERHGREENVHRGPWHGDLRHFDRHDYELWRAGRWRHVRHDGRLGWWWVAGGEWFFYPRPAYPYPDPNAYVSPEVVVVQPSPQASAAPPAPQFWYFCAAANGYYPYVPACPGGWQAVPATPPAASPATPPAMSPGAPTGYVPPASPAQR